MFLVRTQRVQIPSLAIVSRSNKTSRIRNGRKRHLLESLSKQTSADKVRQKFAAAAVEGDEPPAGAARNRISKFFSLWRGKSKSKVKISAPPPRSPKALEYLSKTDRLEAQARIVTQAIREARERGIVDDDETFFHPYPEGTPPKGLENNAIWFNLGLQPHLWGTDIPPVKDKWLETLSLGLTKSIVAEQAGEELKISLVQDYDLEDHERLEQLGDSIVNMSSRLLAYENYPDVNEGTLTRLSNYPTQNNILGILFRESGLADKRTALRYELRASTFKNGAEEALSGEVHYKRGEVYYKRDEDSSITRGLVKKDADMFEAYVAAVFLSHGSNFNLVHRWLCELFRPFQDQAFRFMVARSDMLTAPSKQSGRYSSSLDPILSNLETTSRQTEDGSITNEFLTVAARSRRHREGEQRKAEDEKLLMQMGWFQTGFLNLKQAFNRLVTGVPPEQQQQVSADHRGHVRRKKQKR